VGGAVVAKVHRSAVEARGLVSVRHELREDHAPAGGRVGMYQGGAVRARVRYHGEVRPEGRAARGLHHH